eukprot:COSAG04_NODE_3222_length_3032_cov_4.395159_5_plen_45_part_00
MSGGFRTSHYDGFVDGIYHYLWQKISQQSCPNVSIPGALSPSCC